MNFAHYEWLHALWLVPVLGLVIWFAMHRRDVVLQRFAERVLHGAVNPRSSRLRQVMRGLLAILAIGALVVALARPQWNATPQNTTLVGRDVCIIVDVSRSMLAEDLAPNRLERSKLWIRDVLDVARGDRVALIAFAGTAVVRSPLTRDYGFIRMALEDLDTDSVSRGGTLIGDAVRLAMTDVFDLEENRHRDIILITDGEDHESFPIEAAIAAGGADIRIIAIGIGNDREGTLIPVVDEQGRRSYLTYNGEPVRSRLDENTLREVALNSADGRYLNVATGTVELDRVYERLVRDAEKSELESRSVIRYEEKFQVFLGIALTLLFIQSFVSSARRVQS